MSRETLVRRATQNDAKSLADLAAQFAGANPSSSPSAKRDLRCATSAVRQLLAAPHVQVLVAKAQAGVVGCVVFSSMPSLVHGGRLLVFVDLIVVLQEYRRRGIGTQLMAAVIDSARRDNAYKVVLTTRADNTPGVSLHKSRGLVENGVALALYISPDQRDRIVADSQQPTRPYSVDRGGSPQE